MKFGVTLVFSALVGPNLGSATEFVLQLPLGAKATYSKIEKTLPALVPIAPFTKGQVPKVAAPDNIRRTVWSMGGEQTILEVQDGIIRQLEGSGYEVLMFCVAKECGGFDFRFGIDVVDEPDMRVDLRNFRFVSAKQTVSENPSYVTFLLSRSPDSVYVQMTEYNLLEPKSEFVEISPLQMEPAAALTPGQEPSGEISFILEGLMFANGRSEIDGDPNGVLEILAAKLTAEPDLNVLLVGHSDMSGSLQGNITISEDRAETVRQSLIKDYGISGDRLSAHGVGFLSPRADNSTEIGQQKNRRVEAVFSR
jgi:outer membrane protein OmpA-like peptidoglycan-associated protein